MFDVVWKIGYLISRDFALFNFPILRKLRNKIYEKHLRCRKINVDFRVRIQALHATPDMGIKIGDELHVGANSLIDYSGGVEIGNRVTISDDVKVYSHSHNIQGPDYNWRDEPIVFSRLSIDDDVWLASGATVLASVSRIWRGAVIAAGSIVTRDVEAGTVVAGNPARVVSTRRCAR
ncbi:MAG: acyltransferase [Tabrizicola sp.]